jgi:stearoyl-CoA desaturase (delta-9 desaturase)
LEFIYQNRESIIANLTQEGFHNYDHTFQWDYRASEFASGINLTSYFIEFFARIGWAYNLKKVDPQIIEKRKQRTGEQFFK